jgi:hypothetical protein
MWSKAKHIIKKLKPRTNAEFHNSLFKALCSVNSNDLESWYEECGYKAA